MCAALRCVSCVFFLFNRLDQHITTVLRAENVAAAGCFLPPMYKYVGYNVVLVALRLSVACLGANKSFGLRWRYKVSILACDGNED